MSTNEPRRFREFHPDEFFAFQGFHVSHYLRQHADLLTSHIKSLLKSALVEGDGSVAHQLTEHWSLVVPKLDFNGTILEQGLVSGVPPEGPPWDVTTEKTVLFRIPFRGDTELLTYHNMEESPEKAPKVRSVAGTVCFEIMNRKWDQGDGLTEIRRERDAVMGYLDEHIQAVSAAVREFNDGLYEKVLEKVRARREELEADEALLASLRRDRWNG